MSVIGSPLRQRCQISDFWTSVMPNLLGCAIPYFSKSFIKTQDVALTD
jgi:hypothetical protein